MSKLRVFQGDFPTFESFLTPKGDPVVFYQNITSTTDPEVAEFILTIKGVEEIEVDKDFELPVPPKRSRERNWQAANLAGESATSISHAELLQRAVTSSASTPQAAESISLPEGGTGTPAAHVAQAAQVQKFTLPTKQK